MLECSNCGTNDPRDAVARRSWDVDLPPVVLCAICSVALSMGDGGEMFRGLKDIKRHG